MNKKALSQIALGSARVLAAVLIGAIVGGLLFAGIDWLRTFQANTSSSVSRYALEPQVTENAVLALVAQFIDWYSTYFYGYSRFGSGLGIIIGAFWSMGVAKEYSIGGRIAVGFIAGFCMGLRSAMFITSRPYLVLVAALLGGCTVALYLMHAGRPSRFAPLPRLQFKHQP